MNQLAIMLQAVQGMGGNASLGRSTRLRARAPMKGAASRAAAKVKDSLCYSVNAT